MAYNEDENTLLITQQPGPARNIQLDMPPGMLRELMAQRPLKCPELEWKTSITTAYQYIVAPMAAISGLQGGMQFADQVLQAPKPVQWCFGLGAWMSFLSGFATARIPKQAESRCVIILSSLNSIAGAAPSTVLTRSTSEQLRHDTFSCLRHVSMAWLDYMFAATNGISNCILGVDEGHAWCVNFKAFFDKLVGDTSNKERVLLVLCGLIVAYLAATGLIGYTPPVVHLIAKFAPQWAAVTCGVFANTAEWMFQTNMMFTSKKEDACCCYLRSPLPQKWQSNKIATFSSVIIGLMGGLAMASFTFATFSNPILAYLFTATAWTGGFWTGVIPSYECFTKPTTDCCFTIWKKYLQPCF